MTWEKLAGDTSKFAIRISFAADPDSGVASTAEESLSWGSFQIWVEGQNLCAHQYGEERVESVHWYLLPLLEWLIENWDPIFHEERLPNRNAAPSAQEALKLTYESPLAFPNPDVWDQNRYDWWSRHCLEAARFGGLFPAAYFRRWRDRLEISWHYPEGQTRNVDVRFLSAVGCSRLTLADVATPLYGVLVEAITHLLDLKPDSQRLRLMQTKIAALTSDREAAWAWLLGFGNTLSEMRESWKELGAQIEGLPQRARAAIFGSFREAGLFLEPFPAALMFGAVSPDLAPADRWALVSHLASCLEDRAQSGVDDMAQGAPLSDDRSWKQGYELAEDCLERFAVAPDISEPVDVDAVLSEGGVQIKSITLIDRSVRAVAIAGPAFRPTILINQNHPTNKYRGGRRFSLAHELCHLLYDRARAREVTLPSGPWAPKDIEQRANAFAAMFLMPRARLERLILSQPDRPDSRGLVQLISQTFEASYTAAVEHAYNLGLIEAEDRDFLLTEALDARGRRGMA